MGPTLERRLLNLEHVMATLNEKLSPPRSRRGSGAIPPEEEALAPEPAAGTDEGDVRVVG